MFDVFPVERSCETTEPHKQTGSTDSVSTPRRPFYRNVIFVGGKCRWKWRTGGRQTPGPSHKGFQFAHPDISKLKGISVELEVNRSLGRVRFIFGRFVPCRTTRQATLWSIFIRFKMLHSVALQGEVVLDGDPVVQHCQVTGVGEFPFFLSRTIRPHCSPRYLPQPRISRLCGRSPHRS